MMAEGRFLTIKQITSDTFMMVLFLTKRISEFKRPLRLSFVFLANSALSSIFPGDNQFVLLEKFCLRSIKNHVFIRSLDHKRSNKWNYLCFNSPPCFEFTDLCDLQRTLREIRILLSLKHENIIDIRLDTI